MAGDKMEKLLAAAAQVIGQKGYAQATMAEIAEVAGIGKGTIYEYCKSKEALLGMLMEYQLQLASQQMMDLDHARPPLEILKTFVRQGLDVMEGIGAEITLNVDFWSIAFKNRDSRIYGQFQCLYDKVVGMVEGVVKKGQASGEIRPDCDARNFAMILSSIIDEFFVHKEFDHSFDRERIEKEVCRIMEAALAI